MKIGFINTYFYPLVGGAEQNCLNLALALIEDKGNEVTVFTSDRKDGKIIDTKEEIYQGMKIKRYKPLFRFKYYFVVYPKFLMDILRTDLDIIHVHGFGFLWHDLAIVLKKIISPKIKFINTPHGPQVVYDSTPPYEKIIKKLIRFFEKTCINWVYDIVIKVNPNQDEWIVEYGIKKEKIKLLPNGLSNKDLELIREKKEIGKEECKKKLGLPGKRIITHLGRFSYYKGVKDIVKAFSQINLKYSDTVLVLAGRDDGALGDIKSEIDKLDNIIKSNIIIMEDIGEEEKYELLVATDIFISASEWEAFGVSLLEAMASGSAVISTKTEGGDFLLDDSKWGLVYDYGDAEALVNLLDQYLKDPKIWHYYMSRGFVRSKEFSWSKIGTDYRKLLEELITSN